MRTAPQKQDFFKLLLLIILWAVISLDNTGFTQELIVPDSLSNIKPDSLSHLKARKKTIESDTLIFKSDSLVTSDTLSIPDGSQKKGNKKEKFLDSKVKYSAKDSMRFELATKKMYLYGQAQVDYGTIILKAGYIELNMNTKIVYARGIKDSLGNEVERPVFDEKGQSFTSKEMTFNFETKKGLIKEVITQEGEGYIHGESVKKMQNDELFIKHGKYTTCENPEPHFYIQASKLKVIPNDKVITGPAILVIEQVPTPLALPFGYFPNKKGQSSGIILPTYGESRELGFFLTNGGYYKPLNEKVDISLLGDIYSKGSWALGANSNYHQRYKYRGNIDVKYSEITFGEKELRFYQDAQGNYPFYQKNKGYMIHWRHVQDPKARPNSIFSADVNAGSSNYNQLSSFSSGSANYLTNTLQSNISFSRSWPGKPFNLTLSGGHSQNTISNKVTVTLPQAVFTVNRFFPFKRKTVVGAQKFYEKIGFAYVASTKNEINTADSTLFNRSSLDKFRNGMMQTASASTSMKLLKHFTLNPNVSYTERWYLQSIDKRFDAQSDSFITDTIIGPRRAGEANASANITTKVYGMYQFKRGPVQAIRHIITPSIGLSARPDMSTQIYGYFGQNGELSNYSPYEIGIYGAPPAAKQGLVNFGLLNNLEMKVRSEKDTITGFKKIKILENLSINTSYNVFAEEFHWTPLMISGRTTFLNNFSVVVGGTLDPYQLSNDSIPIKINELEWNNSRLVNADAALTFTLRSKQGRNPITTSTKGTEEQLRMIQNNPNAYVDFNIPWTLNVGYIFRYSKPTIEEQITQTLDLSGDFNLTPKWKFGFRTNYDFTKKEIAYASVDIYRDLHCWEMKFNWVPFGFNKSYNLTINVKAQVLQDLKLTRRSNPFDNRQM